MAFKTIPFDHSTTALKVVKYKQKPDLDSDRRAGLTSVRECRVEVRTAGEDRREEGARRRRLGGCVARRPLPAPDPTVKKRPVRCLNFSRTSVLIHWPISRQQRAKTTDGGWADLQG